MLRPQFAAIGSVAALLCANALLAQSSMTPVAGFGANGWLAPNAIPQLDTSNSQRGMTLNTVTGNIVLVDRDSALGNNAWVIDGTTGAVIGALTPPATGYTGGTFVVNVPGVADDGSIYVCNLVTSTASTFKVYKWDSEAAGLTTPGTEVLVSPGSGGAWGGLNRAGDCFAVQGGGASPVQFAAAGSNSAAGTNSAFLQGVLDGNNVVKGYVSVPGTPTASNGYRLGITFVDQDTIIGTQGATAYVTSFDGTNATVDSTIATGAAQRGMDYAVIGGVPVLAVIDTNSSIVSVYDVSVAGSPLLLTSGTTTSGTLSANANGTSCVAWGPASGNSATLYAMSTNQGIQAFTVTIQQPARATSFGAGCGTPALTLAASAAPVLGSVFNLDASNVPATDLLVGYAIGFVAIPGGVALPIAPGCSQFVVPDAAIVALNGGTGTVSTAQSFPADPAFAGIELFSQAVSLDAGGAVLTSNGLKLFLQLF